MPGHLKKLGHLKNGFAVVAMALALISAPLAMRAAQAETLSDALVAAYKNSGLLDQNRALLRAADEDVAQSVSALRPVLNYFASSTYSDPVRGFPGSSHLASNLGLDLSMLLYDGGNSRLAVEGAKETVLATRQALVNVEQQVLLRAVTAYMHVRRDSEVVGLRQNNVRVITQQLRAAKDRFEVGEVTRTDVAQAESRLAQARAALAGARGALAISREEFKAAVGHAPRALSVPPHVPKTARTLADVRAVALTSHPLIKRAKHEVAAADIGARRMRAILRPSLKLSGQMAVDQNGNDSKSIGLTLGGPIYQGGKLLSLHRQAVARASAARAGLHLAGLNVTQGAGNAWAQLQVARATLVANNQRIRAARVAFRGVKEEASLGARTTLDVLDAEQELLDAQASRVTALTDEYIASYGLLSAMGLLTVDHLRLGIPTYDPAAYYNAVRKAPLSLRGKRLDAVMKALGKP